MNYQNNKILKKTAKTIKGFAVSCLLLLSLTTVFYSPTTTSQTLPDCSALSGVAIQPGKNCLFFGLKLCQTIPSADYAIPSSAIIGTTPNHRVNCADLSDLPICPQIDGDTYPKQNCVKECSDVSFDSLSGTRGQDFAVHNRDCVRFCDAPESGVTAIVGVNCAARRCHQVAAGVTPDAPGNCNLLPCNLLTPDELNETQFDDETKKYCEGSDIKCFDFTMLQLPYVKLRPINSMCQPHNCRTIEDCVPNATDEVQKILDQGAPYVNAYQTYITSGFDVRSRSACKPIICRPTLCRQYRCEPFAEINPTTLNSECDTIKNLACNGSAGGAATCTSGYCTKKIDCKLAINNNQPECLDSALGTSSGTTDTTNSWFYRPKPMDSALSELSTGIIRSEMDSEKFCYETAHMDFYGWLNWGLNLWPDNYWCWDNHSPGKCLSSWRNNGSRGNGYIYLCGTKGLLYDLPDDSTAYHQGYVQTDYVEGDGTHKITVCTRFNNHMDPQKSCGARECMVVCLFGSCGQQCGFDVCRELTIKDSDGQECSIKNKFDDNSGGCMSTIDDYVRVRAVKYKNHICSFLDVKGTLAYDPQYYDGTEKLSDSICDINGVCTLPTCVSGVNVAGTCLDSKNTNDDKDRANVWRTTMRIPYIKNNRPAGGPKGYLDVNGKLFKEQECIKVPYRIEIPKTYNLANLFNSVAMFTPPLYILNSRIKRGWEISAGTTSEPLGKTDFHYPEIEVRFGATTKKLSLGLGYTGYEAAASADPQASAIIETNANGFDYAAEIFVRKEEFSDISTPTFCLYRKIKDRNGSYIDPSRIGCVKREMPEINNRTLKLITPSIDLRKLVIYPDAANGYDDSKIILRYLSSTNVNSTNCSDSGTSCTAELTLSNSNPQIPNCDSTIEKHQVCAQREECSKLNIECIKNEIDLHVAELANQPTNSFISTRKNCQEILLPLCNAKKALPLDSSQTIIGLTFNKLPTDPKIYGWFNEICLSYGFQNRYKNVVTYITDRNVRGKCVINPSSPYLTDSDSSTNCDAGGKAPNCLCVEAVDGVDYGSSGYEVRIETPREAGLCVDMPLPKTCSAIDYNLAPNSDINDLEYVGTSLNNTTYGSNVTDIIGKVHISHQYRSFGKPSPDAIELKGHAEFPLSIIGMNDVQGECKGFWTYRKSLSGTTIKPKLNCVNNAGNALWEADARDACLRYQCNEIFTAGPDESGYYQGLYGLLESGEDKGRSHGFALWPSYSKTNDFLETVTANNCITGFKKTGALATTSGGTVSGSNAVTASLYSLITGYSGGTPPLRQCNQIGEWLTPSNICQRITCPAVTPPTPTSSFDNAAWNLWINSGGATFPATNASRSSNHIQSESIATGTCNNDLGFFKTPGGTSPSRECDSLGNWGPVINPCVTTCNAITDDIEASNLNNGYAKWDSASGTFSTGGLAGTFKGCIASYITNPYPPAYDINGNPLASSVANDLTRAAENPKRLCKAGTSSSGFAVNVWSITVNGCINQCPGAIEDGRIGVGVTTHSTSTGPININWTATNFGEDAYVSNWGDVAANFDASNFLPRTNGYYLLKRHCGLDGKWSAPEAMCAANNGQINNALYNIPSATPGYANSIAAGSTSVITGACVNSNYWKHNYDTDPLPQMSCLFKDSSKNIDQTYLALANGTFDCEERRCLAYPNTLGTYSSIPATAFNDVRTKIGGQIIGTCLNNTTNSSGATVYTSLLTASTPPHVDCLPGGTWSAIINENNCKRGCDIPTTGWIDVNADGCDGDGEDFRVMAFTLQHGQTITVSAHDNCRDLCTTSAYGGTCIDGTFVSATIVNNKRWEACSRYAYVNPGFSVSTISNRDWAMETTFGSFVSPTYVNDYTESFTSSDTHINKKNLSEKLKAELSD